VVAGLFFVGLPLALLLHIREPIRSGARRW
jgi:hypothetical protein